MNQKFVILLFLLAWLFPAYAQKTKIYGKVKNAQNYVIQLKTYSNFLSMTEQVIDECIIEDNGSFILETELQSTRLHVLAVGFQKAHIYLQPNNEYQVEINYDKESEQITFVNKSPLDFQFIDLDANDLNFRIADFNAKANDFLVAHFDQIYKRRNKNLIKGFSEEIKKSLENPSIFLESYIDFRLASIEYSSGLKDRVTIFEDYFLNKEILFGNDEYMQFFNEFFDKYLMKPNPHFNVQQLRTEIFSKGDFEHIYSILNKDPLLNSWDMKELVLLKGLYDLYFMPTTSKDDILRLINKIGQESSFAEIKKMALSIHDQLKYLTIGTDFPQAYVENLNPDLQELSTSAKATFVSFFSIPCSDCIREMDSIASIQKKYSKDVRFMSIALNTSENELNKLIKARNYSWEIKLASKPFKLAENYQLKALPAYFLIDTEARILINPALKPWKGFSESFRSVFKY